MGPSFSALIYVMLGVAMSALLLPLTTLVRPLTRAYLLWSALAAILLMTGDQALMLIATFILVSTLLPTSPASRMAGFVVLVCAVPDYVSAPLPFPGINYLVELNHYKVCVIAAMVPLLAMGSTSRVSPAGFHSIALFVLFSLYTALMTGIGTTPFGGLRHLIDHILVLVLPLVVIQFAIQTTEDFDEVCKGVLVASVILGCVAIVTTAKQWEFYRLHEPLTIGALADYRSGFLRVRTTANTHSLGFHLVTGLLMLELLKSKLGLGWKRAGLIRAVLIIGLLSTDSRGSIVAGVMAASVIVFLAIRSAGSKFLVLGLTSCVAIIGALWLLSEDSSKADKHGTILYRQQLLKTSLEFVRDNPFFGNVNYLTTGFFDHLIQGQKIVDVTNLYLQIALPFGMIGLALFFGAIVTMLWPLFRACIRPPAAGQRDMKYLRRAQRIIFGGMVGWLGLVATTSNVALTMHLSLVYLALGHAAARIYGASASPAPKRKRPSIPVVGTKYAANARAGYPGVTT